MVDGSHPQVHRLPPTTTQDHILAIMATVIRQQRTNKLITRARLVRTINPRKRPEANLTFNIPIVLAAAKRYVSV